MTKTRWRSFYGKGRLFFNGKRRLIRPYNGLCCSSLLGHESHGHWEVTLISVFPGPRARGTGFRVSLSRWASLRKPGTRSWRSPGLTVDHTSVGKFMLVSIIILPNLLLQCNSCYSLIRLLSRPDYTVESQTPRYLKLSPEA